MQPNNLTETERTQLLEKLETRFHQNPNRHTGLDWVPIRERLDANPNKLWSLHEMERTGGEPDVVGQDAHTGAYVFFDCSAESPPGRRSVCYDRDGQTSRKANAPEQNAVDRAAQMGIDLLTEPQYHALQQLGAFDTKTSSWLQTPTAIRQRGGALFGDSRYGRVFVYHNSVPSYYSARGFRGCLYV